ncbi:RNA 2',3'-cyclic phosphodiesterase [Patescibacteria group bacterium]|nr:RNA 2',3'-cyclic phosphodiesterase [Patescibacteria group bacterium]
MRLFVAINLPNEIRNYLKSIQDQLPNAKMTKPKDFHLTLQFLGDAEAAQALEIKSALYQVFMPRLKLKLGKMGVFKRNGDVSVVWIGLEIPEELKRVQSEVEEQLAPLGFLSDKEFKPHLTLARVKYCEKSFEEELGKIEVMLKEFEVNSFSLMESHLSSEGAKYEEIENFAS